jgi:RHS repeat-associated core domain
VGASASGCGDEQKGFIGERHDETSGLVYLNARWYDPALARFVSPDWWDPIDEKVAEKGQPAGAINSPVGMDRYGYAGGDPINKKDPTGHYADPNASGSNEENDGPDSATAGMADAAGANAPTPKEKPRNVEVACADACVLEIVICASGGCKAIVAGLAVLGGIIYEATKPEKPADATTSSPDASDATSGDDRENAAGGREHTPTKPGDIESGEGIDMTDTDTWPTPPGDGPFREGEPSRDKPRSRGEKSLYDPHGGQWRPQQPDKYHPRGHWNYRPPGSNQQWNNIYNN